MTEKSTPSYRSENIAMEYDVKFTNIPTIDVICNTSRVFPQDTKLLTEYGYKVIESIIPGDCLMTHKNTRENIVCGISPYIYSGALYTLDLKYHLVSINSLPEQLWLIREKKRVWDKSIRGYNTVFDIPTWKKTSSISENDYFGMPINQYNITPEVYIERVQVNKTSGDKRVVKTKVMIEDDESWYMMGYFMGYSDVKEKTDEDDVFSILESNIHSKYNIQKQDDITVDIKPDLQEYDNHESFYIKCQRLLKLFGNYHERKIPEWVQDSPKKYIRIFMDGYLTASGVDDTVEHLKVRVDSHIIAMDIQRLYLKLGYIFGISKSVSGDIFLVKKNNTESFIEDHYVWYASLRINMHTTKDLNMYKINFDNDMKSCIICNTASC